MKPFASSGERAAMKNSLPPICLDMSKFSTVSYTAVLAGLPKLPSLRVGVALLLLSLWHFLLS